MSDRSDDRTPPRRPRPTGPRGKPDISWGIIFAFVLTLIITIVMVVIFTRPRPKAPSGPASTGTLGGTAALTAPVLFVDSYEMSLMFTTMQTITNACTPPVFPVVAPIYNVLKIGTLASTLSSWNQYKTEYNGTGAGQECYFYGLLEVETRTGLQEGPADLCHAYVSAGLQYLTVNNLTAAQMNDLLGTVDLAVLAAFPVNMYWKNSLGLNWDINIANALISNVITPFIAAGGRGNIAAYAQSFCNPYFASDQPNYYSPILQVRLAYPYEGLVNKLSKTYMANGLEDVLGAYYPTQTMKNIYVIVDPANPNGLDPATNPTVATFLGAAAGGVPVTVLNADVVTAMTVIISSTQQPGTTFVDPAQVPVLVIGRYVDNAQYYQTVYVNPGTIMFALAPDDPTGYLKGRDLAVVLQNAASTASFSVIDFSAQLAITSNPPGGLGPQFQPTDASADFMNLLMGTRVYAGATASSTLLYTFAISSTLVGPDGTDVGGRLTAANAMVEIVNSGIALGAKRHSFAMALQNLVETPSKNATTSTGGGGGDYALEAGGGVPVLALPPSYDWSQTAPQCISPQANQGSCEDCWARSSADSISARLCIKFGVKEFLSSQQVTACGAAYFSNTDGCAPQCPNTGFSFMEGDVTSLDCMPFIFNFPPAGGCPSQCKDGSAPPSIGGIKQGSYRQIQTTDDIKAELVANGPIAVAFTIPVDFLSVFPLYAPTPLSVTYVPTLNTNFIPNGGHMVMLVGYDDTRSPPAWKVRNTWTKTQGMNGYLHLAQDPNNRIGSRVTWVDGHGYTGTPRVSQTAPVAVLLGPGQQSAAQAVQNPQPGTVQSVYTATVSCPVMLLNPNQSDHSASIQGCANSAQNYVSQASSTANNNLPPIVSAGARLQPAMEFIVFLSILMALCMLLATF